MSSFFINRPIFAMVTSILMVILGALTLLGIPVSKYPEITPPMVQISAAYNGASSLDMEQAVATPIEQQVNGVEEMIYMKSTNANNGTTNLQVSFKVGTDLDNANMLTQNRVSTATPFLPPEVNELGVNVKKSLTFPLLVVSLFSPDNTYDNTFINNYVLLNILDEIKRIPDVGDASLLGGSEYAMRIWLQPDKLAAYGLTAIEVIGAVQEQNLVVPGGQLGADPAVPGTQNTYTVQLQRRLVTEEEFGKILLKTNVNGGQIFLEDVARIELGNQIYGLNSRLNGKESAAIAIYQVPGSNGLEIAKAVEEKMAELEERFPQELEYFVSLDTTEAITVGIEEIEHTLFEAVLLVILVVFIFLQNVRATFIPLLTVPVSLISTFIIFPLLGFSVNTLSLLGLVLAIGLVVDDAIVVVEAVIHHMEHGLSPVAATRKAMKEVSGAVVAIAIILAAVFIPVALTAGITGLLYQQFAITIAISVLFSALNALTLSPALSAILLKPPRENRKGLLFRFFDWFNRVFERFTNAYVSLARLLASNRLIPIVALILIVLAAGFFASRVPAGFVPEEDEGYFMMLVQLPDAASLERTDVVTRKVEKILGQLEGIRAITTVNGYSLQTGTANSNAATFFITLEDWGEREDDAKTLIDKTNRLLVKNITEATAIAFGPPPIPGLGNSSGFTLMLQDRSGQSPEFLAQQTQKFIEEASKRPEVGRAFSLFRANVPQKQIIVDREKAQKLGVRLSDVNNTISTLLGGAFINNFNAFGRQYRAYIQADAPFRMAPEDLSLFFVRNAQGDMVNLSTLARVEETAGPQFTNRFNVYRAAEVAGQPAPGYSSIQCLKALEETAEAVLSSNMSYAWSNMSYQEKAAEGQGATVFLMALLFVFLILAAQYESWSLPFSVLLGTPWAVLGAFLGLFLAGLSSPSYVNNVFAQIGLVMLIGLNAKNAILIVEFAKMKQEQDGLSPLEAAMEAARLRFRPILMTSFAFILGVVPLVTATGAGAEARKVMGMSVFSGMLVATTFGVLLTPALYTLIARKNKPKEENDLDHETAESHED